MSADPLRVALLELCPETTILKDSQVVYRSEQRDENQGVLAESL